MKRLRHRHIALCGLPPTLGGALQSWLNETAETHCAVYDTFSSFMCDAERHDIFIVSMETFVANLNFFLPRKGKVVLLTSHARTEDIPSIAHICINDAPETTLRKIADVIPDSYCPRTASKNVLSQRETDVIREIARGKTNKEIADRLNISVNTVLTHRKNISQKLGIRSASGLSLYALMNALI